MYSTVGTASPGQLHESIPVNNFKPLTITRKLFLDFSSSPLNMKIRIVLHVPIWGISDINHTYLQLCHYLVDVQVVLDYIMKRAHI